jgi:hypothetical protein
MFEFFRFQFMSLREKKESHLILGEERERDRLVTTQ